MRLLWCGRGDERHQGLSTDKQNRTIPAGKGKDMNKTAVDIIKQFCQYKKHMRYAVEKCVKCKRFIIDKKQRKYKYGCSELCPEGVKVLVECGYTEYNGCEQYVREWEPIDESEGKDE